MSPLTQLPFGPSHCSPVQSTLLVRGTHVTVPCHFVPAPHSCHRALPLRSRNGSHGGIKSSTNIPWGIGWPSGPADTAPPIPQHGLPTARAHPSLQAQGARSLQSPHSQGASMATRESPTVDVPRAKIAGSIPAPSQPSISEVPWWRWPRRAGRGCAAMCRGSVLLRLARLQPARGADSQHASVDPRSIRLALLAVTLLGRSLPVATGALQNQDFSLF